MEPFFCRLSLTLWLVCFCFDLCAHVLLSLDGDDGRNHHHLTQCELKVFERLHDDAHRADQFQIGHDVLMRCVITVSSADTCSTRLSASSCCPSAFALTSSASSTVCSPSSGPSAAPRLLRAGFRRCGAADGACRHRQGRHGQRYEHPVDECQVSLAAANIVRNRSICAGAGLTHRTFFVAVFVFAAATEACKSKWSSVAIRSTRFSLMIS